VFGDYKTTRGGGRTPPPGLPADVGRLFYVDPILPGDYSGNNIVDVEDYTVWRDNLGLSVDLPNDPTLGMVDESDFDTWKSHFGDTPADIVLRTDSIFEFQFNYNSALWGPLLGFGQDQDGELYVLLENGNVAKIVSANPGGGGLGVVPEPDSLALLIACALGWLALRRSLGCGDR
jgi:hypothetical protein